MRSLIAQPSHLSHTRLALASLVTLAFAGACSSDANGGFVGQPAHVVIAAGDGLNEGVGSDIGPFIVKVTDTAGTGVPNVTVTFATTGGLTLAKTTATTDASGVASSSGTFGLVAGTFTVTATAAGLAAPATFHATANPGAATSFVIGGGDNQLGLRGTQLSEPLSVSVSDQYGNPISGVGITWATPRGTLATLAGHTEGNGAASNTYTLPNQPGANTVTAMAVIGGVTITLTFNLTGT